MAIQTTQLPALTASLLSTLGHTFTVNGDACSPYFALATDTETKQSIVVSLMDERAGLPRKDWGYALHVIDDISGRPCEIYHDDGGPGTPQEIVLALLKQVRAKMV